MIVAITGSREGVSASVVQRGLAQLIHNLDEAGSALAALEFRCGDARGVDLYARGWLRRNGCTVDVYCASEWNYHRLRQFTRLQGIEPKYQRGPSKKFRSVTLVSNWDTDDGLRAGSIRNAHMLQRPELAHVLIKFHDGSSPGTRNCVDTAEQLGIEIVDGVALAAREPLPEEISEHDDTLFQALKQSVEIAGQRKRFKRSE